MLNESSHESAHPLADKVYIKKSIPNHSLGNAESDG